MLVKMMGSDGKSCFVRDHVNTCTFHERDDAAGWWATVGYEDGTADHYQLDGDAYLMNERGQTIDKFVKPQE